MAEINEALKETISALNKKYKFKAVRLASEQSITHKVRFNEPALDYVHDGGVALNRIHERLGDEHSGKTRDSYVLIESFQHYCFNCNTNNSLSAVWEKDKQGYPVLKSCKCVKCKEPKTAMNIIVDIEGTTDVSFISTYFDIDLKGVLIVNPDTMSMTINIVDAFARNPNTGLIFVDGIGMLSSDYEIEKAAEDVNMNRGALSLNSGIRKWQSALNYNTNRAGGETPTTILLINRQYETLSIYSQKIPQGGRGLRHAKGVSVENKIKELTWNKDKSEVLGVHRKIQAKKNKTGMPYRQAEDYLNLDRNSDIGYCRVDLKSQYVDFAIRFDMIESAGGWFKFGNEKFHGRGELQDKIMKSELKQKIDDVIYGGALVTSSGQTSTESQSEAGNENSEEA